MFGCGAATSGATSFPLATRSTSAGTVASRATWRATLPSSQRARPSRSREVITISSIRCLRATVRMAAAAGPVATTVRTATPRRASRCATARKYAVASSRSRGSAAGAHSPAGVTPISTSGSARIARTSTTSPPVPRARRAARGSADSACDGHRAAQVFGSAWSPSFHDRPPSTNGASHTSFQRSLRVSGVYAAVPRPGH